MSTFVVSLNSVFDQLEGLSCGKNVKNKDAIVTNINIKDVNNKDKLIFQLYYILCCELFDFRETENKK